MRRERASRNGSTVVDISIYPPSFKFVPLLSPRSPLSKTPKQVFFNPIKYILTLLHTLLLFFNILFSLNVKIILQHQQSQPQKHSHSRSPSRSQRQQRQQQQLQLANTEHGETAVDGSGIGWDHAWDTFGLEELEDDVRDVLLNINGVVECGK